MKSVLEISNIVVGRCKERDGGILFTNKGEIPLVDKDAFYTPKWPVTGAIDLGTAVEVCLVELLELRRCMTKKTFISAFCNFGFYSLLLQNEYRIGYEFYGFSFLGGKGTSLHDVFCKLMLHNKRDIDRMLSYGCDLREYSEVEERQNKRYIEEMLSLSDPDILYGGKSPDSLVTHKFRFAWFMESRSRMKFCIVRPTDAKTCIQDSDRRFTTLGSLANVVTERDGVILLLLELFVLVRDERLFLDLVNDPDVLLACREDKFSLTSVSNELVDTPYQFTFLEFVRDLNLTDIFEHFRFVFLNTEGMSAGSASVYIEQLSDMLRLLSTTIREGARTTEETRPKQGLIGKGKLLLSTVFGNNSSSGDVLDLSRDMDALRDARTIYSIVDYILSNMPTHEYVALFDKEGSLQRSLSGIEMKRDLLHDTSALLNGLSLKDYFLKDIDSCVVQDNLIHVDTAPQFTLGSLTDYTALVLKEGVWIIQDGNKELVLAINLRLNNVGGVPCEIASTLKEASRLIVDFITKTRLYS